MSSINQDQMTTKERIDQLRQSISEHNHSYYVKDAPTISDFEFDQMLSTLIQLEKENPDFFDANSPSQRVGGQITKNFETITHEYRMYSLDNS